MKSYLISALAVRFNALGLDSFVHQHTHDWLVWEAGAWKPPTKTTLSVASETLKANASRATDSLAIAMERASPRGLILGRAHASDLVINDGTLSGHHLTFHQLPDHSWTVEDAHSKNGTKLDGDQLTPGAPVLLRDATRIDAAHVQLMYYTAEGIASRLKKSLAP